MRTNQKTWVAKSAHIRRFAEKRGDGALSSYAMRTILEYQMEELQNALEEIEGRGIMKPFAKKQRRKLKSGNDTR